MIQIFDSIEPCPRCGLTWDGETTVSVVVPFVDRLESLIRAIVSLEMQCHPLEIIVSIDSASQWARDTAAIEQIVRTKTLLPERHKFLVTVSNRVSGAGATRNHALAQVTGSYVAFLDDDDEFLMCKVSQQLNFMKIGGLTASHTSYQVKGFSSKPATVRPLVLSTRTQVALGQLLHLDVTIATPTVMLSRGVAVPNGGGAF